MSESRNRGPGQTSFGSIAGLFTRLRVLSFFAVGLAAILAIALVGSPEPVEELPQGTLDAAATSNAGALIRSLTPNAGQSSESTPPGQDPTAAQESVSPTPVPSPTLIPSPTPILNADVRVFGAKGDGITDDSDAIRAAIETAKQSVTFPQGVYVYSGVIRVERDGLRLIGSPGAVLLSSDTDAIRPLTLIGANTSIEGLTIRSSTRERLPDANYIVHLAGRNQSIIDSNVEYGGILIQGATNCLIANNSVRNSPADSIRHTDANNCRVLGNTVRFAGDDMISVVSTLGEAPLSSNILIEGNNLAHQFWGRGIAVVGGENITIRNNLISDTYAGAGIIVAQEDNYNTYGVRNVLIEGNEISNVQTTGEPKDGIRIGHGGIVLNANSSPVLDILIRNNTIAGTMTDGVDVRNNSCGIAILSNVMADIGRHPIRLDGDIGATSCVVVCRLNVLDGEPITHEQCGGAEPLVTGYLP